MSYSYVYIVICGLQFNPFVPILGRDTAKYMDEMVVKGLVPPPWSPLK